MADRSLSPEEAAFLRLGRAYQEAVRDHLAAQEQRRTTSTETWRRHEQAARALLEAAMGLPEKETK